MTKAEMETIILFNEQDENADIYTFNMALINKLERFSERYPDLCKCTEKNADGSRSYELSKHRLGIMLSPPWTEEHKKAVRERRAIDGFKKKQ